MQVRGGRAQEFLRMLLIGMPNAPLWGEHTHYYLLTHATTIPLDYAHLERKNMH